MATKTLTITEDAYEMLKARKEANESFSEVIKRIAGKKSFSSFFNILTPEEGDAFAKAIEEHREISAKTHTERMKRYFG